jgi:transposase
MGAPFKMHVLEQPDHYFGIEGIQIMGASETYDAVRCVARVLPPVDRPACPSCRDSRKPRVQDYVEMDVFDTPSRGRKTILTLEVPRYRHRCGETFDGPRPAFLHPDFPATRRLIRYVEGQTFRRPVLDIAREVGMDEHDVRTLAKALAIRLHHWHRFPTPAVLGIDDLHIRKRIFTVVTDGQTGHAIALIRGGKADDVKKELKRRQFDFSAVRCVVSDMSGSNNAVVEKLFKPLGVIHVADKWHVLRFVHRALSRVISQEIDRLEKAPPKPKSRRSSSVEINAATIRDARSQLMSARTVRSDEPQGVLDLDLVGPVLAGNKRIGQAFWSKIRLHQAFDAPDRATAIKRARRFVERASHKNIREEMTPTIKHLWAHRHQILGYWKARWPNGSLIKPTTGPTERRNGSIRKIWRSAHGYRKHELFELRVLYEPWTLDVDILPCAAPRCYAVDGPRVAPSRRFLPVQDARDIRCADHG